MEYDISRFVTDFSRRTIYNYELINHMYKEKLLANMMFELPCENQKENIAFYKTQKKPFEVTQLINSLFGLIIIPTESFESLYFEIKDDCYYKDQCSQIEEEIIDFLKIKSKKNNYYCNYSDKYEVFGFIKHLKNALSHSGKEGIHFYPISDVESQKGKRSEITHVFFYDTNKYFNQKKGYKYFNEFCVKLRIEEIVYLINMINRFYLILEELKINDKSYKNEINALLELLKEDDDIRGRKIDAFEKYRA